MAKRQLNKTTLCEALNIFGFVAGEPVTKKLIIAKYRKLAMDNHPDKGGDAKKFAKIAEAKEVLIREIKSIENNPESNGDINSKFDSSFAQSIINSLSSKSKSNLFTTYSKSQRKRK